MANSLQTMLRFNSIKGNVILSITAMGLFTLAALAAQFLLDQKQETLQQQLQQELIPAMQAIEATKSHISGSSLTLNAYLESGKGLYLTAWTDSWQHQQQENATQLKESLSPSVQNSLGPQLSALEQQLTAFQAVQTSLMKQIQQDYQQASGSANDEAYYSTVDFKDRHRTRISQELYPAGQDVLKQLSLLQVALNNQRDVLQAELASLQNWSRGSSLFFLVLILIAGTVLSYLLVSQIIRSLYHIKKAVKELSQGNLPQKIRHSRNETNHITAELSKLTQNLRNVQEFALKVGEGQFNNDISVFNNSGELGSSLASMRESLSRVALEDQQRNWINEGFARFGDILRNHNHSISELCDVTISNLVKYTGANQGAIFLIQQSDERNEEVLKMNSCYAYERKKYQTKEILKGEGLCGQAWQENDVIHINDIPEDYVNIRSGLGGANPTTALVVPLTVNEQTQGVLELASFTAFHPHQIEFIRKIAENMASAIATAKNNEKTHRLLEEFQSITEQMRAQEEEMRQNMEELKATQEEMERAQKEIVRKEQNLNSVINNTSDTIFAIDRQYRITVVNKVLSDKYRSMGINLEEGTLISDVLPKSAWEKWKLRYDRALAGEQYSLIEESSGSSGSRFSQTYHNPIKDDDGNIIGVSVVSRDVTDTVSAQQEAERKRSTINSLINNTDDTYFAIDTEYRILIANKTLRDRFAASNITLEEGDNIFDKLPPDQHANWKARYDRALSGESFVMTTERPLKDKVLLIEVHHLPIVDTDGKIIGATVISKDITRWKEAIEAKESQELEIQKLRKLIGLEQTPTDNPAGKPQEENSSKKA